MKVGDIVICIDNPGRPELIVGKEYVILSNTGLSTYEGPDRIVLIVGNYLHPYPKKLFKLSYKYKFSNKLNKLLE